MKMVIIAFCLFLAVPAAASQKQAPRQTTKVAAKAPEQKTSCDCSVIEANLTASVDLLTKRTAEVESLTRTLKVFEPFSDLRLLSSLEVAGEEAFLASLGEVRIAGDETRMVIRIPRERAEKARKIFSRVDASVLRDGTYAYYFVDRKAVETHADAQAQQ